MKPEHAITHTITDALCDDFARFLWPNHVHHHAAPGLTTAPARAMMMASTTASKNLARRLCPCEGRSWRTISTCMAS
jgi:hypothetical protein